MVVPSQRECSTLAPNTAPLVTTGDIGLSNHLQIQTSKTSGLLAAPDDIKCSKVRSVLLDYWTTISSFLILWEAPRTCSCYVMRFQIRARFRLQRMFCGFNAKLDTPSHYGLLDSPYLGSCMLHYISLQT